MVPSILLLSALAIPILAIPGAGIQVPAFQGQVQAYEKRATYIGGWPIGLDGTGGSCPDFAPVNCGTDRTSLNTQCCPSGNICSGSSITAYCCPSRKLHQCLQQSLN
jgi:hypothetical protein